MSTVSDAKAQAAVSVEREAREAFLDSDETETLLLKALDRATERQRGLGIDDAAVGVWETEREQEQGPER